MELRVVRYFLAVVDEGSITRGATAVRIAQPSLSRQLRGLESDLGLRLFDRAGGRLRLTPAGRRFLPYARDLVARSDAAVAAMREPAETRSVSLTVVAPHVTITDVIAPYLATLGRDALKVTVHEAPSFSVFKTVLAGDADLGVAFGPAPGELAACPIGEFGVWAQLPPAHRMAGRDKITLDELVAEPLVLLDPDTGTRRLFDSVVNAAGLTYRMVTEAALSEVVQTLAVGGLGVAVVSDDARYGLRSLAIDVGGRDLRFTLFAAWDSTHFAASTIAAWAQRLGRFTAENGIGGASAAAG
jgi:DNA-binding transcriptional LysR family regulator